MTIHQSVKHANLAECRQTLYGQIGLLGIKSPDINSTGYAEYLVKTTQNQNSWLFTPRLSKYLQIDTPQVNAIIRDS
jgi:hypothetical protein